MVWMVSTSRTIGKGRGLAIYSSTKGYTEKLPKGVGNKGKGKLKINKGALKHKGKICESKSRKPKTTNS